MNILLTSVGRRSYIIEYFKEAFAGKGLVFAGNSEYTAAMQKADGSVLTPLIYDPSYIDFLKNFCIRHDIKAVLSLFDIDLPVLARSKTEFLKHGITVLVSDYPVTIICNDKWESFRFLVKNGIKTPLTFHTLQSAYSALDSDLLSYPLVIKARWGMGSLSVYYADNLSELEVLYSKVKKEVFSTYLRYESSADQERSVIIQEKISGIEYGLDIINDLKKNYIKTFTKRKINWRGGETDHAITEINPELDKLGHSIAEKLKHIGILDVDCIIADGLPFVLDMNCRFGGCYPFAHLAGANIPLAIYKWLSGETAGEELFQIQPGVECVKEITPAILFNH